jgi:hypothetical protein
VKKQVKLNNLENYLKNYQLMKQANIPRMRFQETNQKDSNDEDSESEASFKFSDDNDGFLFDTKKDKELQRREGLSNGLILYNNRRTVNVETSDYSELYYDIISKD